MSQVTAHSQALHKQHPLGRSGAKTKHHHYLTKRVKHDVYHHTIDQTAQHHLNGYERRISKVIHADYLEPVLDIVAATVLRPQGIIAGSLVALSGGVALYVFATYYGIALPYTLVAILFAIGYLIEMMLHVMGRIIWRLKQPKNAP